MRRLIAALAALAIFCSPAAAAGVPANPIFQTETLLAPPTWSSLTLHGEICNSSAGVMSSSATGCPGVVQSVANGGTGQSAAGAAAANAIGAAAIANNLSDMASLSAARANLIPANSLTLAQFPTLAALTVIGSVGGGTPAALTQTQLTAFINPATASLSGALPAWPNTTTTYFRGDATYQPLNFAAIGGVAAAAQLPTPTASTLGGGESIAQVAHQVVQYLDTSGVHHLVQLAFADLTGSIVSAQCPNATVSATGCDNYDQRRRRYIGRWRGWIVRDALGCLRRNIRHGLYDVDQPNAKR